jgi:hypothetical protein
MKSDLFYLVEQNIKEQIIFNYVNAQTYLFIYLIGHSLQVDVDCRQNNWP